MSNLRIWVDVYDVAGTMRQGEGPILTVSGASVKRTLDGAGTFDFDFSPTDERALRLLDNEQQVRLWVEVNGTARELGRGRVRDLDFDAGEGGMNYRASGPDMVHDLTRRSTLLNRRYDNETVRTVLAELVSIAPDWEAVIQDSVAGDITIRFDGPNVLKAVIAVVENAGLHFREGDNPNTLEIGSFGTQQNVWAIGTGQAGREIYGNRNVILIDHLSQNRSTQALGNWIIPLGAGTGSAALTLEHSNRSSPYLISTTTGPDGATLYYLQHDLSVEQYGQIQKVLPFKSISPAGTDAASLMEAANSLYDAAAAWLDRNAVRQETYSLSGRKTETRVRPGDKIKVTFRGYVLRNGVPVRPVDVDDWFWVLSVTERVANEGISIDLEVSNVDKPAASEERDQVSSQETIEILTLSPQEQGT